MRSSVYRSRTRRRMSPTDWAIAVALAFPFTLFVLLVGAVEVFG